MGESVIDETCLSVMWWLESGSWPYTTDFIFIFAQQEIGLPTRNLLCRHFNRKKGVRNECSRMYVNLNEF